MVPTFWQVRFRLRAAPIDKQGVEEMNMMQTDLQRKNLEEFLHDLICGARNSQEVGILVEVLMAMQVPEPEGDSDHNQECPRLSRSSVKKEVL
jgi:hypothetical protein